MDITRFQAEDFDPKAWINETLSSDVMEIGGSTNNDKSNTSPLLGISSSTTNGSVTTSDMSYQVNNMIVKLQALFTELSIFMEEEVKNAIQKIPNALFEIERMKEETVSLFLSVTHLYKRIETIEENCYQDNKYFETLKELVNLKTILSSILLTLEQSKTLTKSLQQLDLLFRDISKPTLSPNTNNNNTINNNINNNNTLNNTLIDVNEISIETLKEMTNQICNVEECVNTLEPYSEKVKNKSKPKLLNYKEKLIEQLIGNKFVNEMTNNKNNESKELIELVYKIDSMKGILKLFELYYEKTYQQLIEQQTKSQQFYNQMIYILKQEDLIYKKLFQGLSKEIQQDDLRIQVKMKLIEYCFKHLKFTFLQQDDLQQLIMIQYKSTKQFAKQLGVDLSHQLKIQKLIFDPFVNLQSSYLRKLEKEYTLKQVKPHLSMSDNIVECIDDALIHLFNECENALERCITFTYGIESQPFIKTINQVFEEFGTSVNKIVNNEMVKFLKKKNNNLQVVFGDGERQNIQNGLKLYEIVNDKERGIKQMLDELENKIKNRLLEILKDIITNQLDEYYVKIQTDQVIKQLNHFYNSLQEVQLPLLSVAIKSIDMNILSPIHEFAKNALTLYVKNVLSSIAPKPNQPTFYYSLVGDKQVEYIDDAHLPELHHSIQPSRFITQIGEYLVKLPEQLEILKNDDHVTYWLDTVCKETISLMTNNLVAPTSGQKFQIQQWNADIRYIRHLLVDVLDFQGQLDSLNTI